MFLNYTECGTNYLHLIIHFREIRKRNDIPMYINNSLCAALYNTIRTYF